MLIKIAAYFRDKTPQGARHRNILGLAIFSILVILAIFLLPWAKTWNVLRTSNATLILIAFGLTIPAQIFTALSTKIVSESQSAYLSFWRLYLINLTLSFYDIILPSTLVVSGLRWYRYTQQSNKPAQSLVTIAYLKIFNISLAIFLSLGLVFFTGVASLNGQIWQLALLFVLTIAVMFFTPYICKWILAKTDPPARSSQEWTNFKFLLFLWKYLRRILEAFADFRKFKFRTQMWIIVIGIANQVFQYLGYMFIAQSVGISLTYAQLGTLRAVILLAANLPLNFGVGIGLRELSLAATLSVMGVRLDKVVAMTVVVFARTLLFGAIGGLIELIQTIFGNLYYSRTKQQSSTIGKSKNGDLTKAEDNPD
jgi:uncharacterized protein (TIRG00374 family)